MVLLHIKRSDQDHFLLGVPAQALGGDALALAVRVSNLRHRLLRLCEDGTQLLCSGPAPQTRQDGADSDEEPEGPSASNGPGRAAPSQTAPAGIERAAAGPEEGPETAHNGAVPAAECAEYLERALAGAKQAAHTDHVARRLALTEAALLGALDAVRGAVLAAFPGGLLPWDPVRRGLEGAPGHQGPEALEAAAAELWFAGRALALDAPLSARLGRNDKTRVVLRLQRRGLGAPVREPVVDEETHKAMLAWHFKKQEQQKKLAEDDGTTHYDSAWANPKALKAHFSGVQTLRLG
ncbi:hypothetical protein WJX81_007262 [Elliptochloris bilobata]|uniref:Uncharacterized protein n=1 Tax=Elliptochloris bilobata TaxID=381761 RepID=A0AAW1SEY2_9CHLO